MGIIIIGVDPGESGGIAILREGKQPITHKMPETARDLFELFAEYATGNLDEDFDDTDAVVAFCEKVHSSPQMGVVSAFKFGQSFGELTMALVAAGIRIEFVTPQKWQRHFGLIVKGCGMGQAATEKKNRNKARAQERFPGVECTHAISDALLIADYGREQYRKGATAR